MAKFKVGDEVAKNPVTWVVNEFDDWGRGLGVGVVVQAPFDLAVHELDVRWPGGRCFETEEQLLQAPTAFERVVLGHLLLNYESLESVSDEVMAQVNCALTKAEVFEALVSLAERGFVDPFCYDQARNQFVQTDISAPNDPADLWFLGNEAGRACAHAVDV